MNKALIKSAIPLIILAIFFIASTYVAQSYEDYFQSLIINRGLLGISIYILIEIIATVVAPLSSFPLIPIAANIWGPFITAIASFIGWMIGSIIAFYISRKYGRRFVEKIMSKESLEAMESRVPKTNLFWSIVLLRLTLPVDVLSYVLGLFKTISWRVYLPSTFIGIIPFSFIFSYTGSLPLKYQIPIVLTGLFIVFIWLKRNSDLSKK